MIYKVLIVDDSKLARMSVRKALSALYPEWTSVDAGNADQALQSLTESAPDIALLDFNMPGRNGLDLAADFRKMRPNMPVAVVSANRQREIIDRTEAIGATFLGKPLTDEQLGQFLAAAATHLDKAKP